MSDTVQGMPSAAQIIEYTDGLATIFKSNYSSFSSLQIACQNFRGLIQGDGTNPSIGHAVLEKYTQPHLSTLVQQARYEIWFKSTMFPLIQDLNNTITAALPSGWSMGSLFPINGWLSRINGNASGCPATPTVTMSLVATTTQGGALSNVSSGNAPRVVYTYVGANNMLESLPSVECVQVALVGSQNSFTGTITGNVPTGVTALNVYRGVNSGITGVYYLDQTVALTAGSSHPSIIIQRPDSFLNTTVIPPSWLSCMMTPEFDYLYALASATTSPIRSSDTAPLQLISAGMMDVTNTVLSPSNWWLGIGNVVSSGIFGTKDLTGAYIAGSIQNTNVPANNSQGYIGSQKLRARASTMLNGTYHPTISYSYIDATHPTPQTATGITPTSDFAGSITDETVTFTITAGRIVLSVSETAHSGTATTGNILCEGVFPRSY